MPPQPSRRAHGVSERRDPGTADALRGTGGLVRSLVASVRAYGQRGISTSDSSARTAGMAA